MFPVEAQPPGCVILAQLGVDPPFSISTEEAPGGMSAVFLTSQSCLSTR